MVYSSTHAATLRTVHLQVCLLILCLLGQLHSGYALLAASVRTECEKKCCHGKDRCCKRTQRSGASVTAAAECSKDCARTVAITPTAGFMVRSEPAPRPAESFNAFPSGGITVYKAPVEFALYANPPPQC